MASSHIGPVRRNPDHGNGEHQYAYITGADTYNLVAAGGGCVHTVVVGVVGTFLKLYDTPAGGTTDATTQIATISLAALGAYPNIDAEFSKGLVAIVTGAAELTITFRGAPTVSDRTFGT